MEMLHVYFITIIAISGIYAQREIIGPSPANQAVVQGTDHTLTCRRADPSGTEGSISWTDVTGGGAILIYLNEAKQTVNPKYTNFNLDENNLYDLVITNIAVEDEGSYVCQNTFDTDGAVTVEIAVEGIYGQELIGPTPATQAVLIGTDHTLTCRRGDGGDSGSIFFIEATQSSYLYLFVNGAKQTSDATSPKYSNFNSDPDNPFDIVITNIKVEDEGTYYCQNPFYGLTISATRTVEVPMTSVDLSQEGSPTSLVTVQAGVPSEIKCKAIGARPAVTIVWYHAKVQGSETQITNGINQVDTPNGDVADSVSTMTYTATKDYDGGSLRCVTTGQDVATPGEATASLNVQCAHPPTTQPPMIRHTTTQKPDDGGTGKRFQKTITD